MTTTWTEFYDCNGGGEPSTEYSIIYIEAPYKEALEIFEERFGFNADRISCECCGEDYSIEEHTSLVEATEFNRQGGTSLEEYLDTAKDILLIYKKDDCIFRAGELIDLSDRDPYESSMDFIVVVTKDFNMCAMYKQWMESFPEDSRNWIVFPTYLLNEGVISIREEDVRIPPAYMQLGY